jgi:hypothetical protein
MVHWVGLRRLTSWEGKLRTAPPDHHLCTFLDGCCLAVQAGHHAGMPYYFRPAVSSEALSGQAPAAPATQRRKVPIVYLHGVGVGLLPYILVRGCNQAGDSLPL